MPSSQCSETSCSPCSSRSLATDGFAVSSNWNFAGTSSKELQLKNLRRPQSPIALLSYTLFFSILFKHELTQRTHMKKTQALSHLTRRTAREKEHLKISNSNADVTATNSNVQSRRQTLTLKTNRKTNVSPLSGTSACVSQEFPHKSLLLCTFLSKPVLLRFFSKSFLKISSSEHFSEKCSKFNI